MEKAGSASGRGNMRSSARSPILVIILLVLSAFLAYSYWSQSAKNGELSNELESLQIDFRAVSDKHLTVEKKAADMSVQIREKIEKLTQMEAKVGETEQKLTDSTNEVNSIKEQLQKAKDGENGARTEAEQVKQEKNSLSGELELKKKEIADLKSAPKVCDKEACREPLREVITALTKAMGKPPISGALKQNNVDLMSVAADLLEEGEDANNQPVADEAVQQAPQDKPKVQEAKAPEKQK